MCLPPALSSLTVAVESIQNVQIMQVGPVKSEPHKQLRPRDHTISFDGERKLVIIKFLTHAAFLPCSLPVLRENRGYPPESVLLVHLLAYFAQQEHTHSLRQRLVPC